MVMIKGYEANKKRFNNISKTVLFLKNSHKNFFLHQVTLAEIWDYFSVPVFSPLLN
jgi:hypothetical protein